MKRFLQLVTLVSCASYTATAQDLAYKIPENAFSVVSVKSNQLFQLCPANEFNNSTLGKKFLAKLSETAAENYKSIEELGINLTSNAYYYYQMTDSINIHGLLIPLTDGRKMDALFNKQAGKIKKTNGISVLQNPDQKTVIAWNGQLLYMGYSSVNNYFFSDSAHAAMYGINKEYTEDYFDNTETVEVDTVVAPPYLDGIPMADSTITVEVDSIQTTDVVEAPSYETVPPPPVLPDSEITAVDEVPDENKLAYEGNRRIKDSLAISWLTVSTQQIFEKSSTTPSILNNPGYQRSADNNAIATFWMTDVGNIYSSFLPYYYMKYGNFMRGYGDVNARLYMGKESVRLIGEMGLDAEKSAAYRSICDHKLNKKFLKYIKSDSLIGFMSYAFNTEAYMYELPKLMVGTYGHKYQEEMVLASDLLSLMIDEKAIAEVVKGDALFLMTNLSEKQVTYQSYNYDEETYEYRDTVMTKTETLPDFLCMFSSDDTRLIEKLLQYGIRKQKIQLSNGIYSINQSRKNPFNLHILIKDGIVFLGTSTLDISQIRDGSFKGNLDKQQKELLTKNNMALFFSPKALGNKIPPRELGEASEKISQILGGAGNVYITTAGIKDGYMSVDMTADVPKDKENALKYFLDLIEDMQQLK